MQESLLSSSSGYSNYRGVLNWCVVMLVSFGGDPVPRRTPPSTVTPPHSTVTPPQSTATPPEHGHGSTAAVTANSPGVVLI